jgi:hypothetical protein
MNERIYNRVANALLLVGIASALLFDSGKVPHWVAGTIGILAGVGAMVLYFWNQYQIEEKKKAAIEAKGSVKTALVPSSVGTSMASPVKVGSSSKQRLTFNLDEASYVAISREMREWGMRDPNLRAIEMYRKETARLFLSSYAHHARTLQWQMPKGLNMDLMRPEVELSPNEVAVCAMEIMRNLSVADKENQWEYVFGSRGLRVKRANVPRTEEPQEEFDFYSELEPLSRAS